MTRIRRVEMQMDESSNLVSCTFVTCCVSWVEMREAVEAMRDKLNEQIAMSAKCPMAPVERPALLFDDRTEEWPLRDILLRLAEFADDRLTRKDYDGHGHEALRICVDRVRAILKERP